MYVDVQNATPTTTCMSIDVASSIERPRWLIKRLSSDGSVVNRRLILRWLDPDERCLIRARRTAAAPVVCVWRCTPQSALRHCVYIYMLLCRHCLRPNSVKPFVRSYLGRFQNWTSCLAYHIMYNVYTCMFFKCTSYIINWILDCFSKSAMRAWACCEFKTSNAGYSLLKLSTHTRTVDTHVQSTV